MGAPPGVEVVKPIALPVAFVVSPLAGLAVAESPPTGTAFRFGCSGPVACFGCAAFTSPAWLLWPVAGHLACLGCLPFEVAGGQVGNRDTCGGKG